MSVTHDSVPDSHAKAGLLQTAQADAAGLVTDQESEAAADLHIGNGADLGGHTSLFRPPAPQGRKSLFRR
jgi:hypothetical protein